jgi:hypothetical protein
LIQGCAKSKQKFLQPILKFNPDSEVGCQLRNLPRRARPSLHLAKNKFVLRQMAGLNPEEMLRKLSVHRFRPEGQIPKIGIWAKASGVKI